jgi:phasin
MANDDKFEMPMAAFAEKSVEQARAAFESFVTATQEALNRAQTQALTAQGGMREMSELAMRYTERNIQASFEFAQKLVRAKDTKEMVDLQTDYIRRQIDVLSEQALELGKQAAKLGTPPATS